MSSDTPCLDYTTKCHSCFKCDAQYFCTGCHKTKYCSFKCQQQHWSLHVHNCYRPPPGDDALPTQSRDVFNVSFIMWASLMTERDVKGVCFGLSSAALKLLHLDFSLINAFDDFPTDMTVIQTTTRLLLLACIDDASNLLIDGSLFAVVYELYSSCQFSNKSIGSNSNDLVQSPASLLMSPLPPTDFMNCATSEETSALFLPSALNASIPPPATKTNIHIKCSTSTFNSPHNPIKLIVPLQHSVTPIIPSSLQRELSENNCPFSREYTYHQGSIRCIETTWTNLPEFRAACWHGASQWITKHMSHSSRSSFELPMIHLNDISNNKKVHDNYQSLNNSLEQWVGNTKYGVMVGSINSWTDWIKVEHMKLLNAMTANDIVEFHKSNPMSTPQSHDFILSACMKPYAASAYYKVGPPDAYICYPPIFNNI